MKWIKRVWRKVTGANKRAERDFLVQVGASVMTEILRNRDLRRTIQHKAPTLDMRLMRLGVNVRKIASEK